MTPKFVQGRHFLSYTITRLLKSFSSATILIKNAFVPHIILKLAQNHASDRTRPSFRAIALLVRFSGPNYCSRSRKCMALWSRWRCNRFHCTDSRYHCVQYVYTNAPIFSIPVHVTIFPKIAHQR